MCMTFLCCTILCQRSRKQRKLEKQVKRVQKGIDRRKAEAAKQQQQQQLTRESPKKSWKIWRRSNSSATTPAPPPAYTPAPAPMVECSTIPFFAAAQPAQVSIQQQHMATPSPVYYSPIPAPTPVHIRTPSPPVHPELDAVVSIPRSSHTRASHPSSPRSLRSPTRTPTISPLPSSPRSSNSASPTPSPPTTPGVSRSTSRSSLISRLSGQKSRELAELEATPRPIDGPTPVGMLFGISRSPMLAARSPAPYELSPAQKRGVGNGEGRRSPERQRSAGRRSPGPNELSSSERDREGSRREGGRRRGEVEPSPTRVGRGSKSGNGMDAVNMRATETFRGPERGSRGTHNGHQRRKSKRHSGSEPYRGSGYMTVHEEPEEGDDIIVVEDDGKYVGLGIDRAVDSEMNRGREGEGDWWKSR